MNIDDDVLRIIDLVVSKLAYPFKFGFHEAEDMKQEGRVFALEALRDNKFNKDRGNLYVFLTNHVRNRFINMKRNKFQRLSPPCSACPFARGTEKCVAFINKPDCGKWQRWQQRNLVKRSLMNGSNPNNVSEDTKDPIVLGTSIETIANKELLDFIDKNIPVIYRADYCRMFGGVPIAKHRKEKILEIIRTLIDGKFDYVREDREDA